MYKFDLANASFEFRARNWKKKPWEKKWSGEKKKKRKRCWISHHFKRIKEIGAEFSTSVFSMGPPENAPAANACTDVTFFQL